MKSLTQQAQAISKRQAHRIAVVVSHPIQHFCPQFCSWSRQSGVHLHVFFASRHGLNPYHDTDFGRSVQWAGLSLDFPHTFLPGAETRAVDTRTDAAALEAELDQFAPYAIIVFGHGMKLQRRAAHWATMHGVATIMVSDSNAHQHSPWWQRLRRAVVLPAVYAPIHVFLTVGDSNEAHYRSYGVTDKRMVRCPFPIDVPLYDSVLRDREAARMRVRAELSIPAHHKVVLMVGKLVPWKRQIDLVRYSNQQQGKRDDITVVFAGTGRDEPELRRATQCEGPGGVVFAGFVDPTALASYYCAADVYVHCSQTERHSLAISEAIYTGLPIVLSDQCGSYGPTDDVQVGRNGYVYACGDIAGMTHAIDSLLDQPALRKSMGEASTQIARVKQEQAHGSSLCQALRMLAAARAPLAMEGGSHG